MILQGEYVPSPSKRPCNQVELYESSNGREGNDLNGMPVIIVTSKDAQSGALRKVPLMRVEHDGEYLAVASMGGAPKHPVWHYNFKANPDVQLQDQADKWDMTATELPEGDARRVVGPGGSRLPAVRRLPEENGSPDTGFLAEQEVLTADLPAVCRNRDSLTSLSSLRSTANARSPI